ncbi:MAG: AEC family transporter [Huintestinicola sp.]|uniref:AEC family transporter n=1 Tax=Huintestinicola sp. TaxID=2981661 RepID=UPI003F04FBCB
MNDLVYSLNATMPVFLVILIGYILNRLGMFTEGFIASSNKFIFNVCLPVMVFADLAKENIIASFNGSLVIYSAVITTIAFALIWLCARLFIKDRSIIGAFVQASYRSSVAVMGFAFMQNIYGSSGLIPMIIIGCVPLYNIYAVTVLTFEAEDARNDPDKKNKLKKAAVGIIKNPIIIGIIAGCIGSLLNVYSIMPPILDKTLTNLSAIATPLSLIVIGASFEGRKAIAKIKPTAACCAVKLIIMPLVFITAAVLLGFRDEALLALVIMLGSPTTPSCYIMAKNMKNDGVLTSSVIAATTLLSSVTLTFWIFIVRTMGYIS